MNTETALYGGKMEKETELTRELKELLRAEGADLAGVGDLTEVPANGKITFGERVWKM